MPWPPIMIAGGGEQLTLRAVARYADACNVGGSPDAVKHKFAVLRRHCDAEKRSYDAIERTSIISFLLARDEASLAAKRQRLAVPASYYGIAGTISQVTDLVGQYQDAGVQLLISSAYKKAWKPMNCSRRMSCRDLQSETELTMLEKVYPVTHSDAEWRQILTADQFDVMRGHGTEAPGSCALLTEKRAGRFSCAGCAQLLFDARLKFESGTGWPSFNDPIEGAVETTVDRSYGMVRTEVHCANCGSHLGHVFPDGPPPTNLRYCINGIAMNFTPD